MAGGAVHQVDGVGAVREAGLFIPSLEAQPQVLQRPPVGFDFQTPDLGVEVRVDRTTVDDL
ncbi:hypothetical protein D3C83_199720 [compost metagenome]